MTEFTPISALLGGMMIGLAAVMFLALNGRIMGVSGVLAGALTGGAERAGRSWRAAFLAGAILAPAGVWLASGEAPAVRFDTPLWLAAAAGLLVGFGARFGSGCTSGHGVCGLSRLSLRSLVATGVFMTTGVLAATLLRPVIVGA